MRSRMKASVDFVGKSQAWRPYSQFETEPKVRRRDGIHVESLRWHEGLLILGKTGAASANVSGKIFELARSLKVLSRGMTRAGLAYRQ